LSHGKSKGGADDYVKGGRGRLRAIKKVDDDSKEVAE